MPPRKKATLEPEPASNPHKEGSREWCMWQLIETGKKPTAAGIAALKVILGELPKGGRGLDDIPGAPTVQNRVKVIRPDDGRLGPRKPKPTNPPALIGDGSDDEALVAATVEAMKDSVPIDDDDYADSEDE